MSQPSSKSNSILEVQWNAVIERAGIAARPMPEDDADEDNILTYLRNWAAAAAEVTKALNALEQAGVTLPLTDDQADMFDGVSQFVLKHYPSRSHLFEAMDDSPALTPQEKNQMVAAQGIQAETDEMQVGASRGKWESSAKRAVKRKAKPVVKSGPPGLKPYRLIAVSSRPGEINLVPYNASEEQRAQTIYPDQACEGCMGANFVCTGETVGTCMRCQAEMLSCSNLALAAARQGAEVAQGSCKNPPIPPWSPALSSRRSPTSCPKSQSTPLFIPSNHTPLFFPSLSTNNSPVSGKIGMTAASAPLKCHPPVALSPPHFHPHLPIPPPDMSNDLDIQEMRLQVGDILSKQSDLMRMQVEMQEVLLDMQCKLDRLILRKVGKE